MSPLPDKTLLRQPAASSGARSATLSTTQLAAARRRLLGATWVIALTMLAYYVLYQTAWADQATPMGRTVAPMSVAVYTALGLAVWKAGETRNRLIGGAFVFHLTLGMAVAAMEPFDLLPTERPYTFISWNCVNILLVPTLLPASTRVVVGFAFALATLTPVGLALLTGTHGVPDLSPNVYASVVMPPFVCALAAIVPSNLMTRLRRDLSRARRMGAYELVEPLGAGGMGEVWKANHRFLARPAAIKLIRAERLGESDEAQHNARRRFEREAQAIAALESPHTVRLYDFGVADDGAFFAVMELLRGTDVRRLVEEHGPMPPERVVSVLLQACASLEEAHGLGLVHRDIKAANLFIGPRGGEHDVVRVLDFGLVKDVDVDADAQSADGAGITRADQIQGTPSTIAPEAATGKAPVDGRADLYALGCVGFYLLTGREVFAADSALAMIVAHVSEEPEPPSAVAEQSIPPALDAVILDCLAKLPDERVASASELARRLRAVEGLPAWTAERRRRWWQKHEPAAFVHLGRINHE
ncbi:MAG: serine/threonine-protein kinase [Sandaracinaceae bacterium]